MGRGSNRAKGNGKPAVPRKSGKNEDSKVRDLEQRLAEALRLQTEAQEELQTRDRELAEAQEQQTATSEILQVISISPTDYQPVFNTIVGRAGVVCGAIDAMLWTVDGDELVVRAHHGPLAAAIGARQPIRGSVAGYAVREARIVHVEDLTEADDFPIGRDIARRLGWRTTLSAPLLREGVAIGAILIRRSEVRPFTEKQVALLKTFADQAVIAIENVRLFNETKEALEQQTATSEILRVISQSQTDVGPVFEAIVGSAVRLLRAYTGTLTRVVGEDIVLEAFTRTDAAGDTALQARFPVPLASNSSHALALRDRAPLNVADAEADPRLSDWAHGYARVRGYRSQVVVPLLRQADAIGTISVTRREPGGFETDEIALIQTFADQAVIAIENVRLFTELQEKNRALTQAHAQVTEALERQTATAEVLRIISGAPTDLQPVFDAILDGVMRLFRPWSGNVCRFDGELIHLAATRGGPSEAGRSIRDRFPTRPTAGLTVGRCILERAVIEIHDVETDAGLVAATREMARARGWRSALAVPMLREGEPVGAIMVTRTEPGSFESGSVELLQTFADQAVIAIENARLFKELKARTGELTQSVEQLTALGEVSRAVSSTLDVETVLDTIVSRASQLAGADGCSIFEYDEGAQQFELRATHNDDTAFVEALRAVPLREGEGLMGRAAAMREPIQVADITQPGAYQSSVRDTLIRFGYRALLSVPLLREDQIIGSLSFNRKAPGEFSPEVVDVLKTFATQSALAIQNARLFHEIEDKSRQLEAASRHKSEFLANMSHELRTPLNAVIGFSEVLAERMFGELNEKQEEYLKDIHASGQHLLSLINDILDLSKIEAGRMELELSDFSLPATLDNALTLVRERAGRHGIALHVTTDERVGQVRADERKIRQVILNLLSNAIKFTPEGGRIDVRAGPGDGIVEVSVSDTGVGIAPEDQEAIFEEFRQVGTAAQKVEGTGLGLALSRKFIELHGGRIWVESEVGVGSTFTFTIPIRAGA
jgi:signal transduction histidine kinase